MIQFKRADAGAIPEILALMPRYYEHDHLPFDREKAEKSVRMLVNDPRLGEVWLLQSPERQGPLGYLVITHDLAWNARGSKLLSMSFSSYPNIVKGFWEPGDSPCNGTLQGK